MHLGILASVICCARDSSLASGFQPSNSTSYSRHDTLYPSSCSSSGLILSLILSQIAFSAILEWFAEIFI